MRMILKGLELTNFKGIKELKIDFLEGINTIKGDNATGKTTIFDAYMWLLWGTDSLDRSDFGIKTYTEDGDTLHGVDHTVTGILDIDGQEVKLSKTYKEVWTKKRGSTEAERTGNTTEYYINDVPIRAKDYTDRIGTLISKDDFKLLSNPLYFSSMMSWKDRREVLFKAFGNVETDEVLSASEDLRELPLDDYTIEEIQAMNKSVKTKLNKERQELPVRIDELYKSKKDYDFDALDFQRRFLESSLTTLNKDIEGIAKDSEELKAQQEAIQAFYKEKNEIEEQVNKKYLEEVEEYNQIILKVKEMEQSQELAEQREKIRRQKITVYDDQISELNKELENRRNEWIEVNKEEFDEEKLICPTCGQGLPEEKAQETKEFFYTNKSATLHLIHLRADELKYKIEGVEESKQKLLGEVYIPQVLKLERPEKPIKVYPDRYTEIDQEIKDLSSKDRKTDSEIEDLKARKRKNEETIRELDAKLAYKLENENIDKRIEEYKQLEKDTAKRYEKAEKMLYLVDEFLKIKAELTSKSINDHFKYITFKLFDVQENGGISETCEPLIDGVPYSDANNAARINAGLEVIKVLGELKEQEVPVFIDNAESVNKLIETDSQQVRLIVSKDKKLKIN